MMDEKAKTAVERIREEAARLGVKVEVARSTPGRGSLVVLAKRHSDEHSSEK